jgi:hypothetical protein
VGLVIAIFYHGEGFPPLCEVVVALDQLLQKRHEVVRYARVGALVQGDIVNAAVFRFEGIRVAYFIARECDAPGERAMRDTGKVIVAEYQGFVDIAIPRSAQPLRQADSQFFSSFWAVMNKSISAAGAKKWKTGLLIRKCFRFAARMIFMVFCMV